MHELRSAWPLSEAAAVDDRLQPRPRSRAATELAAALATGRPVPDPVVVLERPAPEATALHRAAAYVDQGLPVWCEVRWGDRNRVAVEGDLAALADLGVAAVVVDVRPPRPRRVHDLTAADVVRLGAYAGHLVAVTGTGMDATAWAVFGAEVALVAAGRTYGLPSVVVPGLR
jgi:hypothetical protein